MGKDLWIKVLESKLWSDILFKENSSETDLCLSPGGFQSQTE